MESDFELETLILNKIRSFQLPASLAYLVEFYLSLMGINHSPVKTHSLRIALFAEAVASRMEKDKKAAFLGGLFHDTGKLFFPGCLFEEREITPEEYEILKEHARFGFIVWKKFDPLIALCAGLHHPCYQSENGAVTSDFPKEWDSSIIQKGREIATIVSICDFVDAAKHRHTHVRDGSYRNGNNLLAMLQENYPDNQAIVETALTVLSEKKNNN
ncbi:MAG: hypothetical protein COT24_00220 [Candidatus Kerfeldbacteria bacterium CG08_land_8_20_14_0_20_40_16]|uniref:HD/PDEase domain-containing protein n=1 Tax=Candidatus Kerfeldbacteria bacterium CG08_land_8_20_14_0_20_40_16 TaxID=2014244 RepID=A0A2H0YZB1_9BACT|nr:MAG: hypothetical protein COT24_00220 [Candidatus Kerfeldbacteria bacterium CG08_land_8_20_14_0_20_40_16]